MHEGAEDRVVPGSYSSFCGSRLLFPAPRDLKAGKLLRKPVFSLVSPEWSSTPPFKSGLAGQSGVVLEDLPAYAPKLNPDERMVWALAEVWSPRAT